LPPWDGAGLSGVRRRPLRCGWFRSTTSTHTDPDDAIGRLIDAQEVRAALDSLPERLRSALVELYYRDLSVAEAADVLDVPAGTMKSRTFNAVRLLRENLITRGFDAKVRARRSMPGGSG